jgi:hypothetical protein
MNIHFLIKIIVSNVYLRSKLIPEIETLEKNWIQKDVLIPESDQLKDLKVSNFPLSMIILTIEIEGSIE